MQAPEPAGVDPLAFRHVIGRFATGVAIVTTCLDGVHHAMTVNSLTSVSLEPVLVLFCVEKIARFHRPVLDSGQWAVSVLGADMVEASVWFAKRGRPIRDQLEGWRTTVRPTSGAAVFDDAIASLECRTWATYDAGDHTIVVGEVLTVDVPRPDGSPLLYYEGRYLP